MLNLKRTMVLIILLLMAVFAKAQQDKVNAAITFLQRSSLDSAKSAIDDAVANPQTSNNGQAWYLRGFVYKSLYNKNEKGNKQSTTRLEALSSFKKSLSIDTSQENVQENIKNIKYLATTLYNDAAACLDSISIIILLPT